MSQFIDVITNNGLEKLFFGDGIVLQLELYVKGGSSGRPPPV